MPMGLRSSPFLEGVREHDANHDTSQREHDANHDTSQREQGDEEGNDPGWH